MWPQSRYRGRQRVFLRTMRSPRIYMEVACTAKRNFDRECKKTFHTWGNSGIVPYEGTGNQLSRNRQRPTSWGLAIMESRNGALCRIGRVAAADSDLHRGSDRKDRARRGRCIQPGGNRRIHQVARAACRTDRARDGSNVDMAMDRTA